MNKSQLKKALAELGIHATDKGVRKSDIVEALKKVEADASVEKALAEINSYRNKLASSLKEGESLAQRLKSVKGEYTAVDFDGDETDSFEDLGSAFNYTNELSNVVSALWHFLKKYGYQMDDTVTALKKTKAEDMSSLEHATKIQLHIDSEFGIDIAVFTNRDLEVLAKELQRFLKIGFDTDDLKPVDEAYSIVPK